jgi:hypothetical protein
MKEPILLTAVVLFMAVLVLRLVRGARIGKRMKGRGVKLPACADDELDSLLKKAKDSGKIRDVLREINNRASRVDAADLRAAYRCAAGHLALVDLKRPNLAVGFYLRALREDPTCVEALDKLQEILAAQRRHRRLERTYWDVLGRLDDAEAGGNMWFKCWSGLASVYSASQRSIRRADAIRKALSVVAPYEPLDDSESEITQFPNAARQR